MKKRFLSLVLAAAVALTLAPGAFAFGTFTDVSDAVTAQNIEVLRLMGVLEGDGNGTFRPNSSLTRAEFCKMAIMLQGRGEQVVRYASRTIFPDVRATHWAIGYINLATTPDGEKTPGLMHGFPDGTFLPDKTISGAEAAAVLLRALGYSDADTGGIWPDGYLQLAREKGVTRGVPLSNGEITRAQAAQMFVNALTAKNGSGVTLLEKLGYTVDLNADPITLYSVDEAKGVLRTSDKTTPTVTMAKPMASTALNGLKGRVVLKDKKAVTFLPETSRAGGAVSDAAVIVGANGSNTELTSMTGGSTNYTLYRNGIRTNSDALKKYDVLTFDASSNVVEACDTRVMAYYESCAPSQSEPTSLVTLGGTTFTVIPSAQQSLAQFKPGDVLILLLSADGRIAGALKGDNSEARGNGVGYVDADGKLSLICGGGLKELAGTYADYAGQTVSVSQTKFQLTVNRQNSGATGVLDLTAKTLGGRKLVDGVLVYKDGALTSLDTLGARVDPNRIAYARTNSAGEVELIVIANRSDVLYGRVVVREEEDDDGGTLRYISVKRPSGTSKEIQTIITARTGDYVEAVIANNKYTSITTLTRLSDVSASAWVGNTALNYGGTTYTVYDDSVMCWNRDSETWFTAPSDTETALDAAKAYGGRMNAYVKDGVVRVIEVFF